MPDSPYKQRILYDALGPLFDGANSGADPETLPRTQAAYLQNSTVRNDFARPRPAFRQMTLDFGGDGLLQERFTQRLFQGACRYQSDAGIASLISSIAGRMFKAVISDTTATVTDISIVGDLDSEFATIAWLWQSENFVIKNDAINTPVFYDGSFSRRSSGAGDQFTTLNADYTAAAIGSAANATLTNAYTGAIGALITITVGGVAYLFQVASNTVGFVVRFQNFNDVAGGTIAIGTSIIYKPHFFGVASQATGNTIHNVTSANQEIPFEINLNASSGGPGTVLNIPTFINGQLSQQGPWIITHKLAEVVGAVGPQTWGVKAGFTVSSPITVQFLSGQTATFNGVPVTNSVLGTTAASATIPALGANVDITLANAYASSPGLYVFIGNAQYKVIQVVQNTPNATVALVNLNGPTTTNFFANGSIVSNPSELPTGRMGAYWRGRNWIALPDGKSFIASDIRGGVSGTAAYQKRDAPLRVYENNLLAGGGSFSVPSNAGDIQAIIGTAQLDAALGQGPLAIIATNIVFSCNAPSDRTTWATVTDPILSESAISSGGEGQNSTIINNSDPIMRSKEGIRSLKYARRDFTDYGNVPISREVQPTLDDDDQLLLQYGSAVVFNNRLLMTANPVSSGFGVYHDKIIALNSDPLSSLKGKRPPVYDGVWTGLNVLQFIAGKFEGIDRCFAFCLSEDLATIELWEIMPSEGPLALTDDDGSPIVQDIQSAILDFGQTDPRNVECLRLLDGEITIDEMTEDVTFTAYYKPEQWPDWVQWRTWTEKFDPDSDPGYRPRLGLGEPSDRVYDNVNARPLREAYHFQFRVVISGNCRFKGAKFKATTIPKPEFAPVNRDAV